MKPTANVAYASIVDTNASPAGKYCLSNTMPATTPYRKKSYHSTVAPITLAAATRRTTRESIAMRASPGKDAPQPAPAPYRRGIDERAAAVRAQAHGPRG